MQRQLRNAQGWCNAWQQLYALLLPALHTDLLSSNSPSCCWHPQLLYTPRSCCCDCGCCWYGCPLLLVCLAKLSGRLLPYTEITSTNLRNQVAVPFIYCVLVWAFGCLGSGEA